MKLPIKKSVETVKGMSGFVYITDANGDHWFEGTGEGTEGKAADFIVKACNAHAKLVEALKELYEDFSPQTIAQVALDDKIHALLEACK